MDEGVILEFMNNIAKINFLNVLKGVGVLFLVFWFSVLIWVVNDASSRSRKFSFVMFSVVLVALLNVLGLIIYLIIRPSTTFDEEYWLDLEHKYLKFETAGLHECPKCGTDLSPEFNACPSCGEIIKTQCSGCSMFIGKSWRYCPYCGTANNDYVSYRKQDRKKLDFNRDFLSVPFSHGYQYMREAVSGFNRRVAKKRSDRKALVADAKRKKLDNKNAKTASKKKKVTNGKGKGEKNSKKKSSDSKRVKKKGKKK